MPYTYNFSDAVQLSQPVIGRGSSPASITFARVVDVVMDETHPEYATLGRNRAIGAIKYRMLYGNTSELETTELPVAYPLSANIKLYPLVNEIVKISTGPTLSDTTSNSQQASISYYESAISIWGSPHFNASPDQVKLNGNLDPGNRFIERSNIAPLSPIQGDILYEGRHGQSIRFTGTYSSKHPWSEEANNGSPVTIISNGRTSDNGFEHTVEDINGDDSSIYLTSNHKVPLKEVSKNILTYDEKPVEASKYTGKQILVNSGRIFFNAKEESIYLSAAKGIGLSTKKINIEADKELNLNSPKIYIGSNSRKETQPMLKGKTTEEWLKSLLATLNSMADLLTTITTPATAAVILPSIGISMKAQLKKLEVQVGTLHSKKIYGE